MTRYVEVVCTGNICRSPIGEVVLRAKLAEAGIDDVVVTSSGTGGWHAGDPMDPAAGRPGRDAGAKHCTVWVPNSGPTIWPLQRRSCLRSLRPSTGAAQP